MRFEGIRVIKANFWPFTDGCAVTLPGIGIIIGPGLEHDTQLLRHEFGHILQRRHFGWFFYWFCIAPVSLISCIKSTINREFKHHDTWTEWSANRLSYVYFGHPAKWDHRYFPLKSNFPNRSLSSFPGSKKSHDHIDYRRTVKARFYK